ncbi:MAG TPA: O-antigen ligase family protein [Nitrospirota bacterium]|nr:O-antigen ligase family protein [Nitrospirota bacterium]
MELRTLVGRAQEQARVGDLPAFFFHAVTLTLGIYIFIISFPYRTALQEICFYSSLAFLALLYGFKKQSISFNTPLTGPFLFFAVWVFGSLFFSINKQNSFHDFFAYLIKDMALFFLVYNIFGSKKKFVLLTWLIIVSAGIFSFGGMIYFYWILKKPLGERLGLPEVGLGVNYIGYVTVLALAFSATHVLHFRTSLGTRISFFSVAGATLATLFTVTKGTILGCMPLLVILFAKKRVLVLVAVIVALLILAMPVKRMFTADTVTAMISEKNDRPMIWYNYIQMIKDYPVTGIGFGMQTYTPELLNSYAKKHYEMIQFYAPHNTFVDVAVRCGVPGLVLFLYILFAFFRTGLGLIRNSEDLFIRKWALCLMAVFASYLIQGLFSDLLLGIQIKYFFILLAMMAILWKLHAEPQATLNDVGP